MGEGREFESCAGHISFYSKTDLHRKIHTWHSYLRRRSYSYLLGLSLVT